MKYDKVENSGLPRTPKTLCSASASFARRALDLPRYVARVGTSTCRGPTHWHLGAARLGRMATGGWLCAVPHGTQGVGASYQASADLCPDGLTGFSSRQYLACRKLQHRVPTPGGHGRMCIIRRPAGSDSRTAIVFLQVTERHARQARWRRWDLSLGGRTSALRGKT